jgi:proline racemase
VDIASSGLVYAIVDAEAVGLSVDRSRLPELRRSGIDVLRAVNESADRYSDVPHVDGAIFTGPPHDPEAHLRSVTVSAGGAVDRSPCATGTAAVMAVLDAMQLVPDDETFVHEGLLGLLHRARIVRRTEIDGAAAIVPAVQGSAWITGDHTFYVDDDDPLRLGVSA